MAACSPIGSEAFFLVPRHYRGTQAGRVRPFLLSLVKEFLPIHTCRVVNGAWFYTL